MEKNYLWLCSMAKEPDHIVAQKCQSHYIQILRDLKSFFENCCTQTIIYIYCYLLLLFIADADAKKENGSGKKGF